MKGSVFGARRPPLAARGDGAGEQPARERAPREDRDALVDALRDHLPLLLAVDQVVVVLHRDEAASSATCCAFANCHAYMLLAPM